MAENEPNSFPKEEQEEAIINLDEGRGASHTDRRKFIKRAMQATLAVAASAGAAEGGQFVAGLVEEKNQAVTKLREMQLKDEAKVNVYKQFMYGRTISQYINVLGSPDGHSGDLSRFAGFLSRPENTIPITDAMMNGKYERRIDAFVRMKKIAEQFVEENYEAIQESKASGGFSGEPYAGGTAPLIGEKRGRA